MGLLQLSNQVVQNRHTGEQMTHWDMFKKSHQIWIFFVEHVPVRHLLSSMAILYHVIAQLQKTLLNFYVDLQLCKVKAILELNKHWRNKSVSPFVLFH